MRRYAVLPVRTPSGWSARVPGFPDCIAGGRAPEPVLHIVREAIACHLRGLEQAGRSIPEPAVICDTVEVWPLRMPS